MSITTTSSNTYVLATLVAAATAAGASAISLSLALPVWAMFIGWIAFYTRGLSLRSTIENLACVGTGLLLGLGATHGGIAPGYQADLVALDDDLQVVGTWIGGA